MPYQNGYDVLPKLKKLDGPIFDIDKHRHIQEKQKACEKQEVYFRHTVCPEIEQTICDFISKQNNIHGDFEELALQLREDIAVHTISNNRDWLCLAHVCFPSNWRPENYIGKSFYEIHQHVPLMRLENADKLVQAMINNGPFERSVWTVIFENTINGHPVYPKAEFDPENPAVFIRWEKQIIIGFPQINSALFTISQHIIEEKDIDKAKLKTVLKNMKVEHIKYKGLEKSYQKLLNYLHD